MVKRLVPWAFTCNTGKRGGDAYAAFFFEERSVCSVLGRSFFVEAAELDFFRDEVAALLAPAVLSCVPWVLFLDRLADVLSEDSAEWSSTLFRLTSLLKLLC